MWATFIDSLFRSRSGTVSKLADDIKISVRQLYTLRSGPDQPQWGTICLLAEYKGLEPEDLITYVRSLV